MAQQNSASEMNLILETRDTYLKQVKSVQNKNQRIDAKIEKLQSDIDAIQQQIDAEQTKKDKISSDRLWWGDALIKPIIDEIVKRENLTHLNAELVPFGMKSRVPVFFYKIRKNAKAGKLMYALTFIPHGLKKGLMQLETTKTRSGEKHDPVKDPNNFSLIDIDSPDTINGIIKFMKSKKNR